VVLKSKKARGKTGRGSCR